MSFVIQNHDGKRTVPPLRPGPDESQTTFECMRDVGLMCYEMKTLSDINSSLYVACTKCDELVDKYLDKGETKAIYWGEAQNLYLKLLQYFLPEYDKRSAYNAELQRNMEWTYEIFQNWNYLLSQGSMHPTKKNQPPQMREALVSDMRNLLARLQNT